jgi:hypothetical protein
MRKPRANDGEQENESEQPVGHSASVGDGYEMPFLPYFSGVDRKWAAALERFPLPGATVRCRFNHWTFAGAFSNDEDAPTVRARGRHAGWLNSAEKRTHHS